MSSAGAGRGSLFRYIGAVWFAVSTVLLQGISRPNTVEVLLQGLPEALLLLAGLFSRQLGVVGLYLGPLQSVAHVLQIIF